MKLNRFGAAGALMAAVVAVGCSSDTPKSGRDGENNGSIAFKLTTSDGLVDFTSVHYDLVTQGTPPAPVLADDIPVPRPESTISLGIQRLAYGSYGLSFTASGTYHNPSGMNQPVTCSSAPELFALSSPATLVLPTITLTCTAISGQTNNTGNVEANVNVLVVQNTEENIIETFSYGPRAVLGYLDGGLCAFPPIALKIRHNDPAITYVWSDSPADGTFTPSTTAIEGEYLCGSGGTKVLTLTATNGTTTSTKQFTVVCDDTPCGFSCGNDVREGAEQCDEDTARCTDACLIDPSCGDGVVDGPNGNCAGGVSDPDCTEACDPLGDANCTASCTIVPPITCGNNTVEPALGEECDPPNATTCDAACHRIPTCGDSIIDTGLGEECDLGNANSNAPNAACRANCQLAECGDGIIDTATEQCEPPSTATCTATCQTVVASQWDTCETCITNDPDTNEIQQFFCTSASCQTVEECIVNSGCYYPNPTDCYCGIGADLDACLQPSTTVPLGPCAGLYRTATGNLVTASGQIDNQATLDASTLTDNAAGQAQAVISNTADPSAVCFSACGFP